MSSTEDLAPISDLLRRTILRAVEGCPFVVTVEEGCLMGGFGSAVLEAAADAGISTANIRRLGVPGGFRHLPGGLRHLAPSLRSIF